MTLAIMGAGPRDGAPAIHSVRGCKVNMLKQETEFSTQIEKRTKRNSRNEGKKVRNNLHFKCSNI